MKAILDSVRVGNTIHHVHDSFAKALAKFGMKKESRIGYSFGLGFPPDWGENSFSVRENDMTIIKEGMCIHFILGCGDDWDYEFSEALIVTANGPEMLSTNPRILYMSEYEYDFN